MYIVITRQIRSRTQRVGSSTKQESERQSAFRAAAMWFRGNPPGAKSFLQRQTKTIKRPTAEVAASWKFEDVHREGKCHGVSRTEPRVTTVSFM